MEYKIRHEEGKIYITHDTKKAIIYLEKNKKFIKVRYYGLPKSYGFLDWAFLGLVADTVIEFTTL